MRERTGKAVMGAGVALLLLPLTLVTGVMVMLSYPAYPIPDPGMWQILFDATMVMMILGIVAAWRLSAGYLRAGSRALTRAHDIWRVLFAIGALIGLVGAGFAIQHLLTPRTASDHVGFALLAPGVVLVPLWLFLWRQR